MTPRKDLHTLQWICTATFTSNGIKKLARKISLVSDFPKFSYAWAMSPKPQALKTDYT